MASESQELHNGAGGVHYCPKRCFHPPSGVVEGERGKRRPPNDIRTRRNGDTARHLVS